MDGKRFDQIARALARRQNRRAFLAGLAAIAGASVSPQRSAAQSTLPCWNPDGTPKPPGAACIDPSNPCLVTGHCDGRNPECRPDMVEPTGTVCGTAPGPCQDPPTCNATTGECVPGALKPAGTVCREADTQCFVADHCSGTSADCAGCTFPTPDPFVCRIDSGVIVFYQQTLVDCDDGNACTIDSCDPESGCVHTPVNCDDGDACTNDSCDPATGCVHDPIICFGDGNPCTSQECQGGACVTTNLDGDPCGDGSTCSAGMCVVAPPACGKHEELCGGVCLHKSVFKEDAGHCGACGNVCAAGYVCRGGFCKQKDED